MATERRNKIVVSVVVMMVSMLLSSQVALSATYTVGDNRGWTLGVEGWPKGKNFKAGDVLEFKYNPTLHDVVIVDKSAYESCTVPSDASTFNSGDDKIKLNKGKNYFICGIPGHCGGGMKIAVTAN